MTLSISLVALAVGLLIGTAGVGGVLLIPALSALGGMDIRQAMATSLFTFLFAGLAGTLLFQRRGSIAWRIATPVCLGALPSAFAGAWINSITGTTPLRITLATLIALTGAYALMARSSDRGAPFATRPGLQWALLLAAGIVVGFASGLTGVGGPAVSVPLLVLLGFAPLPTIGASQVVQVLAAASGTIGNLRYGSIDFALAAPIALLEVVGVGIGVGIAHRVDTRVLRALIGVLCLAVGLALLL